MQKKNQTPKYSTQQLEQRPASWTTPPPRMPVTTNIIPLLVGNPYKPSFETVTRCEVDWTYTFLTYKRHFWWGFCLFSGLWKFNPPIQAVHLAAKKWRLNPAPVRNPYLPKHHARCYQPEGFASWQLPLFLGTGSSISWTTWVIWSNVNIYVKRIQGKVQFVLQTVLKYEDLLIRSESKRKCKHFNLNMTQINVFDHGQQVTKAPFSNRTNTLPRPISHHFRTHVLISPIHFLFWIFSLPKLKVNTPSDPPQKNFKTSHFFPHMFTSENCKTDPIHCKAPKSTHHSESLDFLFSPFFPRSFLPVPAFFWITWTESFNWFHCTSHNFIRVEIDGFSRQAAKHRPREEVGTWTPKNIPKNTEPQEVFGRLRVLDTQKMTLILGESSQLVTS